MNLKDPKIITVLISSVVSIVTVLLSFFFKALFEKHFFIFKLDAEHHYEQKKRVKEIIAKHKTQLLNSAETLNHRLWNFADNYKYNWHKADDINSLQEHYYLASFSYRMLAFFSWIHKVDSEMVYLDTTIASRKDLNLIKFLRIFSQIMCDVVLFKGLHYDESYAMDHFFRNDFDNMCEILWQNDGVITYSDFTNQKRDYINETIQMTKFLNGIDPEEERLRWDRLQVLHYLLLMFLNTYGYDFQYTDKEKIISLVKKSTRQNKTISNFHHMLYRVKLDQIKEVKRTLAVLEKP